jgi:hypothetical protein
MPTRRGVRVVLLVEDEALERFVRRVLLALDFCLARAIRVKRSPKGQGSAKDWVTRNYPEEVRAHRSKSSYQENIALVVGIDADEKTVQEQGRTLDTALEAAGLEKRQFGERFCLIIAKWHIETWLVHLNGFEVDEASRYKNHESIKDVDYVAIADAFVEQYRNWKQGKLAKTTPPSMIMTFAEMNHLNL